MQVPAPYAPAAPPAVGEYAPPPEFFAPKVEDGRGKPARRPFTQRALILYLCLFSVIGLGLGYLVYVTFFLVDEPFRVDVKLAVAEVRLVDMIRYAHTIAKAKPRVKESRIARAEYDPKMAILSIEGSALGNTDILFQDDAENELGVVRVHVLKGLRRDDVDRAALTVDQLEAQAKELLAEAKTLAKAHLAEAIEKLGQAAGLLEVVQIPDLKMRIDSRLGKLQRERETRFRKIVDKYRQANKLGDLSSAKDLLDEICKLYPDPTNIEHQRAKIFIKRIERRERAQRRDK
ncbi:MAG: hypothetical protein ACYTHM_14015 [Planctomycetota bacterium]|jgi:hypothetical protein